MIRMPLRVSLVGVMFGFAATGASAREAEDYLTRRWYQLEVIVFERGGTDDTVRRQTNPAAYPLTMMPLTNPAGDGPTSFSPTLVVEGSDDVSYSDRPLPIWLVGDCVARYWAPRDDWPDLDGDLPNDPCLPHPPEHQLVPTETLGEGEPDITGAQSANAQLPPPAQPDTNAPSARQVATAALTEAFTAYERTLLDTSYVWQPGTPGFRAELVRLRRRFNVLAAGTWHQPLPPREEPQPLLVQVGNPDAARSVPLEGWFAVTVGRYVHFRARLQIALQDRSFALFDESRRLRSGEVHYLDHPSLGIIVRTNPVDVPQQLQDQIDQLQALGP